LPSFQDEVQIRVRAGKGGAGSVHFHKEKFVEFGGPDGGDGGEGGDVFLEADPRLLTLENYLPQGLYAAEDGQPGAGQKRHGRNGKDLRLKVPLGTQITNLQTQELLCDLLAPDEEFLVAKGGRGGKGNHFFKSSTNQAPRHAQPGEPGEEIELELQLKLIADLGIVGLPNAGKSTLLAALTEAHPKIAGYAFTTLTPNLGVVQDSMEGIYYTLADIPGLVEGASRGVGLGISFLKHIERVRGILFLFDASNLQVAEEFQLLRNELQLYNPDLLEKDYLLVLNKCDLWEDEGFSQELQDRYGNLGDIICISAENRIGLDILKQRIQEKFFSGSAPQRQGLVP